MSLDIQILKSAPGAVPESVRVKLTGSLDTATAPELEKQLEPILAGTATNLLFDLAGLKFITSAGLRVFATARKPLVARKGNVSFVNLQAQIQEVFNIIQALPGVSVFESVEEMDRYLAARQRAVNPNI
jgi:anti-anti-sigma factor